MYDINLFERFKPQPKERNYFMLVSIFLLIVLLALIGLNEFDFYRKKSKLQAEINELKSYSQNLEVRKKVADANKKQLEDQQLEEVVTSLTFIDSFMDSKNVVHDGLLTAISTAVPQNCFLNNIKIMDAKVNLSGYADGYESVAEFQHRLRGTEKIGMIFNPTISEENANYAFSFVGKVIKEARYEN